MQHTFQKSLHLTRRVAATLLILGASAAHAVAVSPAALHEAVQLGDADRVQRMIDAGADIEATGYATLRPLMMAAARGDEAIVEVLLNAGADVNATTMGGASALEKATRQNHADITRQLIEAGADLETFGEAALAEAASACAAEAVRVLAAAGVELDTYHRRYAPGGTPLMIAARRADPLARQCQDTALALIEAGADVNAAAPDGNTAITRTHDPILIAALLDAGAEIITEAGAEHSKLLKAAFRGDLETVRTLIDNGAPPNAADLTGRNGLHYSVIGGHVQTASAFIEAGLPVEPDAPTLDDFHSAPLMTAARLGNVDIIKLLLDAGANVNIAMNGYTPAIMAAMAGQVDVVDALLAAGATIDIDADAPSPLSIATSRGDLALLKRLLEEGIALPDDPMLHSPLIVGAAEAGQKEIVMFLIEQGHDVNERAGFMNLTALHHAARYGHTEIVHLLLEHGAELEASSHGMTPLYAAATAGEFETAKALIEAGAEVDDALLFNAAMLGRAEVVRFLAQHGADVNAEDENGATPLIHASYRQINFGSNTMTVEALLEAGARVNETDNTGRTALMRAAKEGHAGMIAALLDAGADPDLTDAQGRTALDLAKARREGAEREAMIALLDPDV